MSDKKRFFIIGLGAGMLATIAALKIARIVDNHNAQKDFLGSIYGKEAADKMTKGQILG